MVVSAELEEPSTGTARSRFRWTRDLANELLDRLSPRRRMLRELRVRWGKPGTNDCWLANRYFELTRRSDGAREVDDRTWNDLEFPRIFSKLDSTLTRVGSQCLYWRLRTYQEKEFRA